MISHSLMLLFAFYLPGVAPTDYAQGDKVKLYVNALTSEDSQSLLPFDYYFEKFHFCKPPQQESQRESLGSILFGDRLYNSPFELNMNTNVTCKALCNATIPGQDAAFINTRIEEHYENSWIIDGLPAAHLTDGGYSIGFRVGFQEENTMYLYNHFNHSYRYSKVSWGTRWDKYLRSSETQIHWFSIINSIVIVLMLTGMIALILLRALHKDISRYNNFIDDDVGQEDFGWNRGALSTMILIFYMSFAGIAGYVSSRLYKMYNGESWKINVLLTATVLRAYFGFKHPAIENPVKTNQIPRQIPQQPLFLNPWVSPMIGGILPFGAIFIELWVIMNSIWLHKIYYIFGFLFLVFVILIITCAEVSILLCYFHLCSEDWGWHWRSFATSGASGVYVFLYSIVYFFRRLKVDNFPSTILYFGWSLVTSFLFVILTGSVGYVASLMFVRKIFASIKVD
ncbi:Endomembrane protein 70-domain-containing protein [Chytridium lagenaria]|nr:Endomembrane protein 70-domain-containing protein [Chytridium lagenaria]